MTRDDIYDHLAQVYIGKRKDSDEKKKRQLNAWLLVNIVITAIIFVSTFYGLTAFFTRQTPALEKNIVYSLHNGPIRVEYNFKEDFPPIKSFALTIPKMDATKFGKIHFSIRAKEEGSPGIVKVILRNKLNESAFYYIHGINLDWKEFTIPLEEFRQITDWTNLTDVSFVLESWNVDNQKGIILIDDVSFAI